MGGNDSDELLRSLEAERFVQPERVVVEVGDDHEPCNAVLGGGTTRGFDHEARADPSTPKGMGGVDELEASSAGGRDYPAASYHRSGRGVESDVPSAAARAKQGAEVVQPLAAESPVRVLVMRGIASLHLSVQTGVPAGMPRRTSPLAP